MQHNTPFKRTMRLVSPFLVFLLVQVVVSALGALVISVIRILPQMMNMMQDNVEPFDMIYEAIILSQQYIITSMLPILLATNVVLSIYGFIFIHLDRKKNIPLVGHPWHVSPPKDYLWLCLLAFVSTVGMQGLMILIQLAAPQSIWQEMAALIFDSNILLQVLAVGIAAPIAEEVIFRGLIFKRMRERYNRWPSIIISSVIFGLIHGNLIQFIYAFILGVLMAYTYEKFGSIWAPIIFHVIANMLSILMTHVQILQWIYTDAIRLAATIIIGACLSSILFLRIQKFHHEKQ